MPAEGLIIRDATFGDVLQMAALMGELGYPTSEAEMHTRFSAISSHSDYRTLVAEINNVVIGLAGLSKGYYYEHNGGYVRILAFVVSTQIRGAGVGTILLKACETWARETGMDTILLNSGNREERQGAFKFYQKHGFAIKSSGFVKAL
jgi:GNAT superfamily N-acetyltransferase